MSKQASVRRLRWLNALVVTMALGIIAAVPAEGESGIFTCAQCMDYNHCDYTIYGVRQTCAGEWPCTYGGGGCAISADLPGSDVRPFRTSEDRFVFMSKVEDGLFVSWNCGGEVNYTARLVGDELSLIDSAPFAHARDATLLQNTTN